MPQPIMKKYKHGEFGDEYGLQTKEKMQGSMHKKYSHGELSADVAKKPKEKMESWAKAKITQGSHNN